MENLEPSRNETDIDLDSVAKEYAEKLRLEIFELKEKQADPHLKNINPDELTYEDLMIYDKAKKFNLKDYEYKSYEEGLKQYFKEQVNLERKKQADDLRAKFKNNEITEDKFNAEFKKLLQEEDERRKKERKDYISVSQSDSRSNFAAMIKSKLIAEEDIGRHFDNPMFG